MNRSGQSSGVTRLAAAAAGALILCLAGAGAAAEAAAAAPFPPERVARLFSKGIGPEGIAPEEVRLGPAEGNPPAAPVYRGAALAGYVFSTAQVTGSTGYSGKPLDVLVGIDLDGRITGASILEHHEPILVIGVGDADLEAFVAQYAGIDIRSPVRLAGAPMTGGGLPRGGLPGGTEPPPGPASDIDAISGASISSVVIGDAILRSARIIARARGILPATPGGGAAGAAGVDFDRFEKAGWDDLVADGSLARLALTVGAVDAAFAREGARPWSRSGGREAFAPAPSTTFIALYAALATPAQIGRNLLGDRRFNRVMAELAPGDQLIFLAAGGLYSFKGTAFARSGVFDRIQIVQGDRTIRFDRDHHRRLDGLAAEGAPAFREIGLFTVPAASGFDPARPWRLELLVAGEREPAETAPGETAPGGTAAETAYVTFVLPYELPARLVRAAAGAQAGAPAGAMEAASWPLWQDVWRAHPGKIAVLTAALLVLTLGLIFQDWIERRPRFYRFFRIGFLAFTLVWIGWYAGAQLSVINVITFVQALLTGFQWDFFLLGPLIFILWSFVAVTLLFWGRGVFCGWLCPFGALQELLNTAARALRVPQYLIPFAVHERLWMVKYIVFLVLFGLSLYSIPLTIMAAEIEPFKTAISLGFVREWPFVSFAVGLLVAGLFVERFYCRYLCALGAALAIPARGRMFEWLKRRPQCGRECHVCGLECTVNAIHPDGHINLNECIYCLNCQILYYDDHVCPPVIARRKRRETREAARHKRAQAQAGEGAGKGAGKGQGTGP